MGFALAALAHLFSALSPISCRAFDPLSKSPVLLEHVLDTDVAEPEPMSVFEAWKASRPYVSKIGLDGKLETVPLQPGSQRRYNFANIALACRILQATFLDMMSMLWRLNRTRTSFLVFLTIFRGLLPAFRGYSQALILDEIQKLMSSGEFPSARLGHLVVREGCRMLAESLFDSFANHNESIVQSSVRYLMEHRQLEQRLRLDIPTLADPAVRDLLHESDLFVRSFTGLGFGFGLFSPFDLIRVLSSIAELTSQFIVLTSARSFLESGPSTDGTERLLSHPQFSLLGILLLPSLLSLVASYLPLLPFASDSSSFMGSGLYTAAEARESERAERMRSLAHGEPFRAEVMLFGLAPWILDSWSIARRRILGLDSPQSCSSASSAMTLGTGLRWLLTQTNLSEIIVLMQNLPFFIYTSSTSLGSLALYRASLQSLLFNARTLATSFERAFQSVFFMGAFFAAMSIEPHLSPSPEKLVKYDSTGDGMKIEARNLSYSYPGSAKPTLRNVSFTLEAGETLAIVGYNGSGKSTLANVLLRIFDHDQNGVGELLVNDTDIRALAPADYHAHVTALFQTFSKLNATVRENVGIGDVRSGFSDRAVREAAARAGACGLVNALPHGLDTPLECMGLGMSSFGEGALGGASSTDRRDGRQGLSGGEWQRVAISRAFMRARTADLILLDEPTSHLDAHAQNNVFEELDTLCRDARTGKKVKTVIVITHQLSIARRADKIAMFENGTITEFGTHEALLARPGSHYGALYRATA